MERVRSLTEQYRVSPESLFYPDNPDSPSWGHLQALFHASKREAIPVNLRESILEAESWNKNELAKVIDGWNRTMEYRIVGEAIVKQAYANLIMFFAMYSGKEQYRGNYRQKVLLKAIDYLKAKVPFSRN